jgi:hypothetical protein
VAALPGLAMCGVARTAHSTCAFARTGSPGSFPLALRVPTSLTPPVLTLSPYSLGTKIHLSNNTKTALKPAILDSPYASLSLASTVRP